LAWTTASAELLFCRKLTAAVLPGCISSEA